MAIPSTPTSFYAQTANAQNYVSWALAAGATSYSVQRSTDGVSYSVLATPTNPEYLDTSVTIGTQYFYTVASVNSDGTSAYTVPQSVVPVPQGEASLGQLRLNAQQRADRVNSNFVTLPEWNQYINQSLFELYDLLITQYGEEYFAAAPLQFTTNGSSQTYPLPNGVNYNGAPNFYKMLGLDLAVSSGNNAWVTIPKFNFIDRNQYFYPNTNSTIYGIFNLSYRIVGSNLELIPAPSGNQIMRLWYIPRMTMLLKDTDVTSSGVSGWYEYIIVDAAIKALQKEESDVSVLMAQKAALIDRIRASSMNRDAGIPDRISDTRGRGWGGWQDGPLGGNFRGGW